MDATGNLPASQRALGRSRPFSWRALFEPLLVGGAFYLTIGLLPILGTLLGLTLSNPSDIPSHWQAFARFDGGHYVSIVESGYSYAAGDRSDVAFFPVYPLVAWTIKLATGLASVPALLLTSHVPLCGSFVLLLRYAQIRCMGELPTSQDAQVRGASNDTSNRTIAVHSPLLFALFPTTMFFRMTYSESTFLFACLLTMYAIERSWPLPVVCVLCGVATAARPVGVALIVPVLLAVWRRSGSWQGRLARLAYAAPLSCWGIACYMYYLHLQFGEPFAFATTQEYWHARAWHNAGDKLLSLVALEPIWAVYVPGMPGYWKNVDYGTFLLFNLQFFNPIYFLFAVVVTALGAIRRRLTGHEVALAAGLLLIPYLTRAYENSMLSHARFAAVVFPVYLVLGNVLARRSTVVHVGVYAICAFLLTAYSALFAAGHSFF